jgi:hypothetical protein
MEKDAMNIRCSRFALALIGVMVTGLSFAQGGSAITSQLDMQMTEKIWEFIKTETQAPANLPMPPILFDENIPKEARMVFQFPSEDAPDNPMQISIGSTATRLWRQEMFIWALGHELTHYALLMQENRWEDKTVYVNNIRHHCNVEFMRITRAIVEIIWEQYQSVAGRMRMYSEVHKSCSRQPMQ